ncbi:hypothetical protein, partial [Streptomyces sp. NPDC056399]|uniref:hypothetical protein n=1 Tax=Streptomyces sp. NPDC056399 TaxID=3345807 RepID=UPI0035E00D2F
MLVPDDPSGKGWEGSGHGRSLSSRTRGAQRSRTGPDGTTVHLAYCTNVHPAEDLAGVHRQLEVYGA